MNIRIAHIVNPVKVQPGSDLYSAQPITFESIRLAKGFTSSTVDIELFAVGYPEDRGLAPGFFKTLPDLQRSVLDRGNFANSKKLPLIGDILNSLHEATQADYLIYSNADIALMPHFYSTVTKLINEGHDALIINRRGLTAKYNRVEELPAMYADYGVPHPGYDCFIFRRELLSKMIFADICIGVPFCEVALVHNLIAFAANPKFPEGAHLTFHIGSEVMAPRDMEYYWHNRREYEGRVYPRLKPHLRISKFPYAMLPFNKRMFKWLLNPVFRTHQVAELEGKGWMRNLKYQIDSMRFSLLEKIR